MKKTKSTLATTAYKKCALTNSLLEKRRKRFKKKNVCLKGQQNLGGKLELKIGYLIGSYLIVCA